MKINVTMFILSELRRKNSKIAKRVLRWFQRNRWSVIIMQAGIFWFDPIPAMSWIPEYVKQTVRRFMLKHYRAEFVEYLPLPAA